ncbi:MAG: methyltransferase domain-containing protein [Rickettsiales bacterium]|jgi:hypothetical protein|nr:methyltransferase domain-containing protein [Rickettsiales bacterium]
MKVAILVIFYGYLGTCFLCALFRFCKEIIGTKGFKISPYISTNKLILNMIIEYIQRHYKTNEKIRIIDIGSGCGKIMFIINKRIKNVELVGYEIDKFYYSIAKLKNKWKNISFYNDDIKNLEDFNFDIVLTFLFEKQQRELIPLYKKFPSGTLIISNTFKISFGSEDGFILQDVIKNRFLQKNIYIYKKL